MEFQFAHHFMPHIVYLLDAFHLNKSPGGLWPLLLKLNPIKGLYDHKLGSAAWNSALYIQSLLMTNFADPSTNTVQAPLFE